MKRAIWTILRIFMWAVAIGVAVPVGLAIGLILGLSISR